MPPVTLKGGTLGERHKHFNKLVQDAVADKQFNLTKINDSDGDLDNLVKIDAACKTRNVNYIIDVMKCDDMLYVSRAIKQSLWLITEEEFAHIINPEYLFNQMFPHMLAKAINKLLLRIRLHLKDEKRVEAFYDYLNNHDRSVEAEKWLLNCSISFIENVIQNRRKITLYLFKRLCKRSIRFLQYYTKVQSRNNRRSLGTVQFLIKTDTEEFLNVLESSKNYCLPNLGPKHTAIIMKKCPNRILDNFERYMDFINVSMLTKYMTKEDVTDFMLKYTKNENTKYFFSNYQNLKHLIKTIPRENRFQFVKNIYIDKNLTQPAFYGELLGSDEACLPSCSASSYNWYQYAPFSEAFIELKKLIRTESSPAERCAMLTISLTCARKSSQNIKTVLQYYYDKHRNEPFKFKIQFINNLISQSNTYNFDCDTWNILDKLFYSSEVYTESENNVQTCLKAIVLYKVLHDDPIPETVEKKILFDTFKNIRVKLNTDQQSKLFSHLLSSTSARIQEITVTSESSFQECINALKNILNLLIDWKKDLKEYSFVLVKIQELIKHNKDEWNSQLTSLYEMKKSWRKHLFEESLLLSPSEEVCLNALKHDPQLLVRYSDKVAELRQNDSISLKRFLAKLRVYWPQSLAQEWVNAYLHNVNKSTGHKALVEGLFVLIPREEVIKIAKKYTPVEAKIEWSEVDQIEFSLRKNIAKHLYTARPLTSLDVVLWYAKGDYLQYAVPSLNSIIHNISNARSHDYLSKLLEAPVSLQKYGLHLAFIKLKREELKPIFAGIWKTTKNSTIRTHLFTHTYNLLCKVKDTCLVKELWELLSTFIDNLATDENKIIYSKLGKPKDIHITVQGEFFTKSFKVLSSLPAGANCESHLNNLINYAPDIVNLLDSDFIETKMLGSINEQLLVRTPSCEYIDLLVSYVLHGETEEDQCERFKRVMQPVLEHAFLSWDLEKNDEYVIKENIDSLMRLLIWDVKKYLPSKKIVVPVKVSAEILKVMAEKLSIAENYERYTIWALTTEYIKLVAEHRDMFFDTKLKNISQSEYGNGWLPDAAEDIWIAVHIKISPKFGSVVTAHLKQDIEKYFPAIHWLFSGALSKTISSFTFRGNLMKAEILKHMILNDDFVPSYIIVCEEMPNIKYINDEEKQKLPEILKILSSHPSLEVKMHYQKVFGDIPLVLS